MFLMNKRLAACADSTLVAMSVAPARLAWVSEPVVAGKKLLLTTPFWATMKSEKTGLGGAAQAERSGSSSRNGSPTATVPAPRRNARRLIIGRFMAKPLEFNVHLR